MYICIYVYVYIYVCHTYIYTRTNAYTYSCTCTYPLHTQTSVLVNPRESMLDGIIVDFNQDAMNLDISSHSNYDGNLIHLFISCTSFF